MNKFLVSAIVFTISTLGLAQVKGLVVDEFDKPIPYVNIWVEGQNIGTTTEENGTFELEITPNNQNLLFSILGFKNKQVKVENAKKVILSYDENLLNEVVIYPKKNTKELEIGFIENSILQAFENGPKVDVKYIPFLPKYKKTKYIKSVKLLTDSRIETATIKIHFYAVDENGFPGKKLLPKDLIITVNKGNRNNKINVEDFNLIMPENGIFVGFEKIMTENNRLQKLVKDTNTKTDKIQSLYYPFVMYNYEKNDANFTFIGGKWVKTTLQTQNQSGKIDNYHPAINLVLSN
jgi:hypothetical protein